MDVKKISLAAASMMTLLAANIAVAGGKKEAEGAYCQTTLKGQSACAGHGNATCAGKNECEGKGFLKFDKKEACEKNGGKWADAKAAASQEKTPEAAPAAKKH